MALPVMTATDFLSAVHELHQDAERNAKAGPDEYDRARRYRSFVRELAFVVDEVNARAAHIGCTWSPAQHAAKEEK